MLKHDRINNEDLIKKIISEKKKKRNERNPAQRNVIPR